MSINPAPTPRTIIPLSDGTGYVVPYTDCGSASPLTYHERVIVDLAGQLAAKDREIERLNQSICVDSPKMLALNAELLACAEKAEAELEGTKEALRIAQKDRDDHLGGIKRLHELYGEPYYSWQRVYQNTERLLAERDALRAELAAAKEDAERLDWLLDQGYAIVPEQGAANFADKIFDDRAELDAARRAQP